MKLMTFNLFNSVKFTQTHIDKNKVDNIKKDMEFGLFNPSLDKNKIAVEIYNNVIYITEGHHRYYAAYILDKTKGTNWCSDLLKWALRYNINKKPYLIVNIDNVKFN